ncbi:MAG TPA: DCC1-like thiol-disulfide oxidoreductase family protein [Candidatus Hydrogenedentes bacterium]|nr:DCC1-like thiol-disulfide oxidoreductase family protein [Candidatus Hydrogenedentota bacterium]HOK89395.1 DCC1-like thiol-disulfide oxidoreductase family protein [Candidatus Hydrogenedentota bacterium]HOV60402.1 DCC1-like thiol-disulfide oxidoreductase family protein [Candidatus Hydrogenedentota bacterium]
MMNILTVIYDDRCGLCAAARKWAEKRCGETVFFYPASRATRFLESRGIPANAIENAILVFETERVLMGYVGVLCVLKRCGTPPALLGILGFPGIRGTGSLVYRYLARHRRLASRLFRLPPVPAEAGTCHCGGGCA